MSLEDRLKKRLRMIVDPETGIDVVEMDLINSLSTTDDGDVKLDFRPSSFVCPLALRETPNGGNGAMGPDWEGWPFGRPLFVSEVYSLIQGIPGIKHVLDVQLAMRPVDPGQEEAVRDGSETRETESHGGAGRQTGLTIVDEKRIDIPADALLCSLEHEITVVEL